MARKTMVTVASKKAAKNHNVCPCTKGSISTSVSPNPPKVSSWCRLVDVLLVLSRVLLGTLSAIVVTIGSYFFGVAARYCGLTSVPAPSESRASGNGRRRTSMKELNKTESSSEGPKRFVSTEPLTGKDAVSGDKKGNSDSDTEDNVSTTAGDSDEDDSVLWEVGISEPGSPNLDSDCTCAGGDSSDDESDEEHLPRYSILSLLQVRRIHMQKEKETRNSCYDKDNTAQHAAHHLVTWHYNTLPPMIQRNDEESMPQKQRARRSESPTLAVTLVDCAAWEYSAAGAASMVFRPPPGLDTPPGLQLPPGWVWPQELLPATLDDIIDMTNTTSPDKVGTESSVESKRPWHIRSPSNSAQTKGSLKEAPWRRKADGVATASKVTRPWRQKVATPDQ